MPDALFSHPRLAEIYDRLDDPNRPDLQPYLAMAEEFRTRSVLDVGCGTGVLACRLAAQGRDVTGVDPAGASLAVARRRPFADRVRWIEGTADNLTLLSVGLAVMTGNVAQVFVTDQEWLTTLRAVRRALVPGGRFVFESRDPGRRAWTGWTRERTFRTIAVPDVGPIDTWVDLTDVTLPTVSFRHTFVFRGDGTTIASTSTLRFRSRDELAASVEEEGLIVDEVRDAPDRPGLEFVFVTRRAD